MVTRPRLGSAWLGVPQSAGGSMTAETGGGYYLITVQIRGKISVCGTRRTEDCWTTNPPDFIVFNWHWFLVKEFSLRLL